jgi:hypothetical protein
MVSYIFSINERVRNKQNNKYGYIYSISYDITENIYLVVYDNGVFEPVISSDLEKISYRRNNII